MKTEDLIGTYTLVGSNQNEEQTPYKGRLTLTLDSYSRILAKWNINDIQEQSGIGFFKDNILVVNFEYLGEDTLKYKGTVVYKCLTKDILEGFWSEEHGNPLYLGEERCVRIGETKSFLH